MENTTSQICNFSLLPSGRQGGGLRGAPSFLIGAATSNSGKTTFTMGLLRALRNHGYNIQPYKCGPDYIDTMFHHLASGNESINLDSFMSSKEHIKELWEYHNSLMSTTLNDSPFGGCGAIVEGGMGLFDGYNKSQGSSAEIAMLLDIPVILIVNAKSVAYSVAPLIHGFKTFNPNLKLAGVVFNMVASENHYRFLREACEDAGVKCLGYMQKNPALNIPGRHLGLTISAKEEMEKLINLSAEEVEKHVDLNSLKLIIDKNNYPKAVLPLGGAERGAAIAVAQDEAFNFTYKANIDALAKLGDITFFSPLNDETLPPCDLLYLPGGYPELFADKLTENESMRESIRTYAEKGGRIFAECGGFMYLTLSIDGKAMCGVLPLQATMQNAHLHLGYRTMQWKGKEIRGHEFHYSEVIEQELPDSITVEHLQSSAKGTPVTTPLYRFKNVIAGYTHWYWAECGFPFF